MRTEPPTVPGIPLAPTGSGAPLRIRGVSHAYGRGSVPVLHDLDLDIEPGGWVALMGPSGAGKSTLLSLIGGLDRLQTGSIEVADQDLGDLSGDELADYRRLTVGFVFQHYGLVDVLSARENVELSLALSRVGPGRRRPRAEALLEAVGLAHRSQHLPSQLSGGERQRVAIARALANQPRLLLADEPTGNLDEETAEPVMDLLADVHRGTGCTLVVVTHEARVADRADRICRLRDGRWTDR